MTARNWSDEYTRRVEWIRALLRESGAEGIVYGNSGGKDSALVGILCKAACDNTVGLIMPCSSRRNFHLDMEDGLDPLRSRGIGKPSRSRNRQPKRGLYGLLYQVG